MIKILHKYFYQMGHRNGRVRSVDLSTERETEQLEGCGL